MASAIRTWTEFNRSALALGLMAAEAQAVIWMRLWGLAGAWNLGPGEPRRMVGEKLAAGAAAQMAMMRAQMAGKDPAGVLSAAIRPVRRRTGANARRLARLGPKV